MFNDGLVVNVLVIGAIYKCRIKNLFFDCRMHAQSVTDLCNDCLLFVRRSRTFKFLRPFFHLAMISLQYRDRIDGPGTCRATPGCSRPRFLRIAFRSCHVNVQCYLLPVRIITIGWAKRCRRKPRPYVGKRADSWPSRVNFLLLRIHGNPRTRELHHPIVQVRIEIPITPVCDYSAP